MLALVLDSAGDLDPTKANLVTSHLEEDKNRLDPDNSATITASLPIANEQFGISLDTDNVFGLPILNRVDPSSPYANTHTDECATQLLDSSNLHREEWTY